MWNNTFYYFQFAEIPKFGGSFTRDTLKTSQFSKKKNKYYKKGRLVKDPYQKSSLWISSMKIKNKKKMKFQSKKLLSPLALMTSWSRFGHLFMIS